MSSDNFGFEELDLWKKVRIFKIEICLLAPSFPNNEKYKLTDQVIRSVRSFNANIAEGMADFLILTRYTFASRLEAPSQKHLTI